MSWSWQIASLAASRQEAGIRSLRTCDVLLPYSWAEVSVCPSGLQSPKEEGP